jgi:phenylalanyl-tRNA synthetase beta subunit
MQNPLWIFGTLKVLGLLSLFGVSEKDLSWRQENLFPNLHPTCQAAFLLKEEPVAWWGEWNTACDPVGLRGKWGAFEVRSDFLSRMSRPASERTAPKISPFPQIRRDFSFWVPQKLPLTTVFEDLKETAGSFCIAIKLFDRFCNQEGVTSCAVRLIFQSDEKTLTDQDLDLSLSAFLQKAQDYGLKLRDQ